MEAAIFRMSWKSPSTAPSGMNGNYRAESMDLVLCNGFFDHANEMRGLRNARIKHDAKGHI